MHLIVSFNGSRALDVVGLVVKLGSAIAEETALRVARAFESHGVRVLVEESVSYESLSGYPRFSLRGSVPGKLVVVGGDGTLLRTLLKLQDETPIIMGIRAGKRGFLLDVEKYEVEDRIRDFIRGDYKLVVYPRYAVYANGERLACILNDVAVVSKMAKLTRLNVLIDGYPAMRVDGDGVVVSSTVGSTAYSLSAGGPIVDPRLDVLIVTPLNPVQLHLRPLVVPSHSRVEASVTPQSNEAYLNLDGQIVRELQPGSLVAITRCDAGVRMVRFRWWDNFYERLYTRLLAYW
jgi:NAD+ kinase